MVEIIRSQNRRAAPAVVLVGILLLSAAAWAGTIGVFQGKVVAPHGEIVPSGSLYVQGRNGSIRRVDVSHARVEYDAAVPRKSRVSGASESLKRAEEVRVTAEQDARGEWRAHLVSILKVRETRAPHRPPKVGTAGAVPAMR